MIMEQGSLRGIVVQSALFAGLSEVEIAALLTSSMVRQMVPGRVLFHQGDQADHLFQVVSGLVRMTKINAEGGQTTLRIMRAGDVLGCVAALQSFPYPATATAANDVTILTWRAPVFIELTGRYPTISDNIRIIVGDRMRDMVQRVSEMTGKQVEKRIAASLLRLSVQAGVKTGSGIHIAFPVTRADLAEMAGLTYFTVSRTLSAWQKQGLVKCGRQHMTVLDTARLSAIAEPGLTWRD